MATISENTQVSKENQKAINIDPRGIQEALRTYLQPIKNDDPRHDFYSMYKRETTEFDTEYMKKHDEDLNTTLIFAGLFSAVSSAFAISIQSGLQPDPSERSEAYLRAILLSLNPSISPGEAPTTPPAWSSPPQEIVATSNLLYASLLMSLLAAFVAMLGKQWVNRYLRHAGGSMIERCGDRQRKFDGLDKWRFYLFIESLPIMLQIALFLLACGLSRYMWSVNTSVASVVITFTVSGWPFYVGIVVAGVSSYDCPLQTPVSVALRYLRGKWIAGKIPRGLSPRKFALLVHAGLRNTWRLPLNLPLSSTTSTLHAFSMPHRAYAAIRGLFSRGISLSRIVPNILDKAKAAGRKIIALLRGVGQAFEKAKKTPVRWFRAFRRTMLLPSTVGDIADEPLGPCDGSGLQVCARDLKNVQRQNSNDASCICSVLRNMTDPEAVDSAIRLAGTIRWFSGGSTHEPPFDSIVSIFEACFDSAKRVRPGMRNRAYFSAQTILKIHVGARTHSNELASEYAIPIVDSFSPGDTDPDLHHILHLLSDTSPNHGQTFFPPMANSLSRNHSLWMSNLFVDFARMGEHPIAGCCPACLSVDVFDHHGTVANILLMWYLLLGGTIEEETLWVTDKSDSLEPILSHLSTRVLEVIADGRPLAHLSSFLKFLATWEKRPTCLIQMAHRWCSAISRVVEMAGPRFLDQTGPGQALNDDIDEALSGPTQACRSFHSSNDTHHTLGLRSRFFRTDYAALLYIALEVGFRPVGPSRAEWAVLSLSRTSPCWQVLDAAISSDDDETIADALSIWIIGGSFNAPLGSFVPSLTRRIEKATPLSQRLRWMCLRATELISEEELGVSGVEVVRLLNYLNAGADEVNDGAWEWLLMSLIRSPATLGNLPRHYWCLLDKLASASQRLWEFVAPDVVVMRSLEGAEDWEKLEVWMVVMWRSMEYPGRAEPTPDVEWATLKLLLRRPSALPRFEAMCEPDSEYWLPDSHREKLQRISTQVEIAFTM